MNTIVAKATNQFVNTNGIRLHYLEFAGDGPTVILMHGLTANAHAFDGLMAEGLSPAFHVLSIDLRGRGQSDQPAQGYSMEDHAKDIVGLMDAIGIDSAIIGGHSFGALLTLYLAANYPDRVEKLILMDAAARMHPNTKEMLVPALSRLGQKFTSFDAYIEKVKAAPYIQFWDEQMRSYYKADVKKADDDTLTSIPQSAHMMEAVNGGLGYPWLEYIQNINKPAILINGPDVYTLDAALLPEENAMETVNMMKDCRYVKVQGNHQTMLYGEGAREIVAAIKKFMAQPPQTPPKEGLSNTQPPLNQESNNNPVTLQSKVSGSATSPLGGRGALTVLITGSTSGIGLGIAKAFAQQGHNIIFNGLETNGAQIAADIARQAKVDHLFFPANMLQPETLRDMVAQSIQRFGAIDILVNNAGIQHVAPIEEFPEEKWDAIIAINLTAAFHLSKAVWPKMKEQNFGRIINIASAHGLFASEFKSAYVAAKHGIIGFTKTAALEGATCGITCNAICPGYVKTPLVEKQIANQARVHNLPESEVIEKVILKKQAIKQFVSVESIAALCLFVASDAAATLTGTALPVDGGWSAQ
jgi:3-hydroxybutyrate dehydrogenase